MNRKASGCSPGKRGLPSVLPPFTARSPGRPWPPRKAPDGTGAWGCANANGPGLAVLIHKLGAGHSFTEWEKARSGDIMKLWWTEAVGAKERGHLTIYLSQTENSLTFWSSNQSNPGGTPGYGTKTIPKSTVKHVLFTRITRPEAFANAPHIGTDPWLGSLLKKKTPRWKKPSAAAASPRHPQQKPSNHELSPPSPTPRLSIPALVWSGCCAIAGITLIVYTCQHYARWSKALPGSGELRAQVEHARKIRLRHFFPAAGMAGKNPSAWRSRNSKWPN